MRILITGASGFVGRNLVDKLSLYGKEFDLYFLYRKKMTNQVYCKNSYFVNLNNIAEVDNIIQSIKPNIIIHLAYTKSAHSNEFIAGDSYFQNVQMSSNLIKASMKLQSLSKFIFIGSCEEYGRQETPYEECQSERPVTSYGLSKLSITKTLLALHASKNFPSIIVRPSVVYGPGQNSNMFLPSLSSSIKKNIFFNMTEGMQYRDFLYIDDLISLIIRLLDPAMVKVGEVINASYGTSYLLRDIAIDLANMVKPNGSLLLKIGAQCYRDSETMNYFVLNNKADDLLGWRPMVSINTGLTCLVNSL